MDTSVDALALAFRQACACRGLTYSEALNRISAAWGPGYQTISSSRPPEPEPGFVRPSEEVACAPRREAYPIVPIVDECTRQPPHQCGIFGPCNGYPRKSNPSTPPGST